MPKQMAQSHAIRKAEHKRECSHPKAGIRIEMLRTFFLLLWGLLPLSMAGQSTYTLTINPAYNQLTAGTAIPYDFAGLGFEMQSAVHGQYGLCSMCNFFDPGNSSIVTLFENLSLRNIRVGGGTSDTCARYIPSSGANSDLSKLFGLAAAANLKVIYSLPLQDNASCGLGGSTGSDATTASTIMSNYAASLHSFEFGNEPDFHSYHTSDPCTLNGSARGKQTLDPNISEESYASQTDPCVPGSAFPSYYSDWLNNFIAYLPAGAVVSGPDQGDYSAGTNWTGSGGSACNQSFTDATWPQMMNSCEQANGATDFSLPTQHLYVGGSLGSLTATNALENMMSAVWATGTSPNYEPFGTSGSCRAYPPPSGCPSGYSPYPWMNTTLPAGTRLTESNDFLGGSNGASNAFGSALWALDYMQWWASFGATGVNFHNNPWLYTDTIVPNNVQWSSNETTCPSTGCSSTYSIAPKGYGIKAFDLGGHGFSIPTSPQSADSGYIDSFAVGSGQDLYVTIVNRSNSLYGNAATANVSIDLTTGSGASLPFAAASVSQMALTDAASGAEGDLTQTGLSTSTTLGGSSITGSGPWYGEWTADGAYTGGSYTVSVPASTAMVVHFRAPSYYAGPIHINQSGALEMFATKGNTVYHDYQKKADEPASAPSNWNASGTTAWPALTGVTATGSAAVIKNQDNTLEVFVPTSGDVYHDWQVTPSGGWHGWADMGSGSTGLTDIHVGQGADGALVAFGLNSSGELYYSRETGPRAGWSAWTALGGSLSGGVQPGYAVAQNLSGRIEVFAADGSASPQIWHAWQTSSGPFTTSWATLTSSGATVSSPQLAVARNLSGDLEVFGLGTDGYVWHSSQPTPGGGPWSTWSELETGTQIKIQPGFAVGQSDSGDMVVFGVKGTGTSAQVYYNAQSSPGGSYSTNWTLLGSAYTPGGDQIVVSNTADGRMQLFNVGSNGDVYTNWQTAAGGSGSWNGWTDFGSGSNGMSF